MKNHACGVMEPPKLPTYHGLQVFGTAVSAQIFSSFGRSRGKLWPLGERQGEIPADIAT